MSNVRETDFQTSDIYFIYLKSYAYWLLGATSIVFVLSIDRTYLLDNNNYISYFSNRNLLPDFFQQISDAKSLTQAMALFFSEEFLWRIYTQTISSVMSPELSIYFTVLLLNSIIVYSCSKFEYRFFGLLLWILLPMGIMTMGLFQIRQGLGFSLLMLFFARRWNLTIGAVIAAMVHTTFIIPLVIFLFLSLRIFRSKPLLFVLIFSIFCYVVTTVLPTTLDDFGGRRSVAYTADQGPVLFNTIIAALLTALPSIIVVFDKEIQVTKSVMKISMMNIGIFIWLVFCFYFFPLGTFRVGYFSTIFSIFPILVFGLYLWRKHPIPMSAYASGIIFIIYAGVRDGLYVNHFV
jgi:hypothetical protein